MSTTPKQPAKRGASRSVSKTGVKPAGNMGGKVPAVDRRTAPRKDRRIDQADQHVTPENEVVVATRRARDLAPKAKGLDWKAAAGIGIGSAAVVAALLYARSRPKE